MPGGTLGQLETDVQIARKVSTHAILAALGTSMDPAFPSSTLTREVQENADPGDRVGAPVLAVDADSNDVLTYELDGPDMRFFEFDPNSPGQIIISDGDPAATKDMPTLDREGRDCRRFIVTVKATDKESNSATATVNINVIDVNEAPEFDNAPDAATEYDENGTGNVITLRADDPEGRGVDWEVTGTDAEDFTISGGVLRFKDSPNYESPTDRVHEDVNIDGDTNTDSLGETADGANNRMYQVIVRATERACLGLHRPGEIYEYRCDRCGPRPERDRDDYPERPAAAGRQVNNRDAAGTGMGPQRMPTGSGDAPVWPLLPSTTTTTGR